jgi:allantoinase
MLTVFRGHRVVSERGFGPASVHVRAGVVARVEDIDDVPRGAEVVDVGHLVMMPGLVDTHVHVNEPGRTDWEGFATATRAAAAGGVTTILDMPLNSIPATTTAEALAAKRRAAEGQCWVDVGFIGGVVPGNEGELEALHAAGVLAFKCFLVPSGVPEFEHVTGADLRRALPVLARLGAVLMVHAELPQPIEAALPRVAGLDPRTYRAWRRSRPRTSENDAVRLLARLSLECTSCTCRATRRCRCCARRGARAPRSRRRPARTTCTSCPTSSPTARRSSSARPPFASTSTGSCSGARSATAW